MGSFRRMVAKAETPTAQGSHIEGHVDVGVEGRLRLNEEHQELIALQAAAQAILINRALAGADGQLLLALVGDPLAWVGPE